MKTAQISILIFGHDARLLDTRKWALHSRGYRVLTATHLVDLDRIPANPPVNLLVLCHTLSAKEGAHAVAYATSRWPEIKQLALVRDGSRRPSKVLGHVLHTLDAPNRLLTKVSELVGYAGSSSFSHTY